MMLFAALNTTYLERLIGLPIEVDVIALVRKVTAQASPQSVKLHWVDPALEALTESVRIEPSEGDECHPQVEQSELVLLVLLGDEPQLAEPVEPGDGALDHP